MANLIAQTDLSSWTIGVGGPKINKHGAPEWHICQINSKTHPRVQPTSNTLPLRCPFGISQYNDQGTFSISFSIPDFMTEARSFFDAVDKLVLEYCWENRATIFPKKVPPNTEILLNMYTPVMGSRGAEFEPTVRAKISTGVPIWIVTQGGMDRGVAADVKPGSMCIPILSFDKIWSMAGRFGVALRCQASSVIQNRSCLATRCSFSNLRRSNHRSPELHLM
jgi:hypothetical protein